MTKEKWQCPAAYLVMLLHMSIDVVEDGDIEDKELRQELLKALNEAILTAMEWRLLEQEDVQAQRH